MAEYQLFQPSLSPMPSARLNHLDYDSILSFALLGGIGVQQFLKPGRWVGEKQIHCILFFVEQTESAAADSEY